MSEAILWWIWLQLFAFVSLPLCGLAFRSLPDRGYGLSKAFGWLLMAWTAWMLSSLPLGLSQTTQGSMALLIAGICSGASLFLRRGGYLRAWTLYFKERVRYVLAIETLFLLAFSSMVVLRGFVPEIEATEKPMELMYLQAAMLSSSSPPPDLWLAGYPLNYYYFGFYANAFLARASGVAPGVAFNLSLAGVWATGAAALASLGYNAVAAQTQSGRARLTGALATPLLVLLVSNPAGTLATALRSGELPAFFGLFWKATRVVYDDIPGRAGPQETINEFPAASFLLGDLHPHVMSIPLLALGLGATLALALHARRPRRQLLMGALLTGGIGGLLYMTNSWDLPLLLGLAVTSVACGAYGTTLGRMRVALLTVPFFLAGLLLVAMPFILHFEAPLSAGAPLPPYVSSMPVLSLFAKYIGVVWWDHTGAGEFARMWGVHLLVFAVALPGSVRGLPRFAWLSVLASLIALLGPVLLLSAPVLLMIPVVVLCAWGAWCHSVVSVRWALLLAAAGWTLVTLPELIYVRDVFESRMNTAFKFYFQAWQLLGVSGAVLLLNALCGASVARPARMITPRVFYPLVAVVLLVSLLFPYVGARSRAEGGYRGLNGTEFLQRTEPDAYAAVRWLQNNSKPGDVVLEATGGPYSSYARLATYAGRPTVLGWSNHERQWRAGQPALLSEVERRYQDVLRLYGEATAEERQALLELYEVRYAYYGRMERGMQAEADLPVRDPFRGLLTPVWEGETGVLYSVQPSLSGAGARAVGYCPHNC